MMLTLRCPRCGTVYTTDCWAPCPSCNGVVRDIGYAIGLPGGNGQKRIAATRQAVDAAMQGGQK